MTDDALVKEKTVRALTDRMIAAVNALEFDPSMVGEATSAALSALASAGAANTDRVATETARDVALAQVDLFEAPAKAVLDDIMGGDVAGIVTDVARAGEVRLNVKSYGAVGDGATNDTVAVQAAITAAAGNAIVFFPAGTYKVGQLTAPGSLEIEGVGATLKSTTAQMLKLGSNNLTTDTTKLSNGYTFRVRGITFDGQPATTLRANYFLLNLGGFQQVSVDECEFRNVDEFGVYVQACNNVSVQRSRFLTCNASSGDGDNLVRYINVTTVNNLQITDCYFTSNVSYVGPTTKFANVSVMMLNVSNAYIGRNRIEESGGIECYSNGNGITVEGNTLTNFHRYAIKIEESSAVTIRGNALTNGYATTARSVISYLPYARTSGAGSKVTGRSGVTISENIIDNCPQPYLILVQGVLLSTVAGVLPGGTNQLDVMARNVVVTNNTLTNSPCTTPVLVSYVRDAQVLGNRITHCDPSTSSGYITVDGLAAETLVVMDNKVTVRNVTGVTVMGVSLVLTLSADYLATFFIERNVVVNSGAVGGYGIHVGRGDRVRILRNKVRNFTQFIYARNGGNLLVNDNDGPKTTNSVVDAPQFTTVVSDLTT